MDKKTVFISYSHDSDAHRAKVLALSERLRKDGIETILDQYVNGSPPGGWPRWTREELYRRDRLGGLGLEEIVSEDFQHDRRYGAGRRPEILS